MVAGRGPARMSNGGARTDAWDAGNQEYQLPLLSLVRLPTLLRIERLLLMSKLRAFQVPRCPIKGCRIPQLPGAVRIFS